MSCDRESLLTNVTLWPTFMVTCDGLTVEFAPIVIVAPTAATDPVDPTTTDPPPPPPAGDVGELPPHAARPTNAPTHARCIARIRFPKITVILHDSQALSID